MFLHLPIDTGGSHTNVVIPELTSRVPTFLYLTLVEVERVVASVKGNLIYTVHVCTGLSWPNLQNRGWKGSFIYNRARAGCPLFSATKVLPSVVSVFRVIFRAFARRSPGVGWHVMTLTVSSFTYQELAMCPSLSHFPIQGFHLTASIIHLISSYLETSPLIVLNSSSSEYPELWGIWRTMTDVYQSHPMVNWVTCAVFSSVPPGKLWTFHPFTNSRSLQFGIDTCTRLIVEHGWNHWYLPLINNPDIQV